MEYSQQQKMAVGHLWKKINVNQSSTHKSIPSPPQTARQKKYTPLKQKITPHKSLKISSLKSGPSQMKLSGVKNDDVEQQSKTVLKQHRSMVSLIKRMGDEKKQGQVKEIKEGSISLREKKHIKNGSIFKSQLIQSRFTANELQPTTQTIIHSEGITDQSNKNIFMRLQTLTSKNSEQQQQVIENKMSIESRPFLPVQQIFKKCLEILNQTEQALQRQRIQIQRILEDKLSLFLQMKKKILQQFAHKQKQIEAQELRDILKDFFIVNQIKQPLMRVTSERIFNRNTRNSENKPQIREKKVSKLFTSEIGHNFDLTSVKSRESSKCKQKFELIFGAINKIKTVLHENQPSTFVSTDKRLESGKRKQQTKPMKFSLFDLRSKSNESSSMKKLRLSQIGKDISILQS